MRSNGETARRRIFLVAAAALILAAGCVGQVGTAADIRIQSGSRSSGNSAVEVGSSGSTVASTTASSTGSESGASGATSGAAQLPPSSGSSTRMPLMPEAGSEGLPCDVSQLLVSQCQSCHSSPPVAPAPMPLVTYANLVAPSLMDPSKTFAEQSLIRMQDKQLPMPPAPAVPESTADDTVLQDLINAGYPAATCELLPPDAGVDTDGGNPYDTPETCTSMMSWTRGNGLTTRPGEACIACHSSGGGPRFTIAGTLYPTAHEPDDCNGANGSTGAQA